MLYIVVGISGAMQHVVVFSVAKYIVAINKDPDINIFKIAYLGLIRDWKEALPPLTRNRRYC